MRFGATRVPSVLRVEVAVLVASLLLGGLAAAPARRALAVADNGSGGAIWYVGPGGGTGNCATSKLDITTGVVGNGSDDAAIQAAVNIASTGDTIFLCNHRYDLATGITDGTSTATSLILRGESTAGTVVDGGDAVQLFGLPVLDVTVIGLTLRNGKATDGSGGAVRGAFVTIIGSVLTSNSSNGEWFNGCGGAVYGSTHVDVTGSLFADNTAGQNGGALCGGEYGVTLGGDVVDVTASTFARNLADGQYEGYGGAIYAFGPVSATNSTFVLNEARYEGGAIITNGYSGPISVANVTFWDNTSGIMVLLHGSSLAAADSIFAGGRCAGPAATSTGRNLTIHGSCPGDVTADTALDLMPLANYGGPTPTVGLGEDSVARDATTGIGGPFPCFTPTDQRGQPRPYDTLCDIGAFEGPVPSPPASLTFEGAYWVKASGSLTTVPLTALIDPPLLTGCAVTFSLSDGSGTVRTYVATTGLVGDETTASLPKGTYSVDLLGSGTCAGATASGKVTVASGQSTVGSTGSGDYTVGSSVITFDHSISVETTTSKGGGGTGTVTVTSGSITWSPTLSPTSTWRLTGAIRAASASALSTWRPTPCPDDIEGVRPAVCGRFLAGVYTDELTSGTKGNKLDWVRRGSGSVTNIVVTVYDGGTSCTVVRRKQVCTALPDWFGLTYSDGYKPPFADELMMGTMVRLRTGSITVG